LPPPQSTVTWCNLPAEKQPAENQENQNRPCLPPGGTVSR